MTRLRWSKQSRKHDDVYGHGAGRVLMDYTDLVPLADIIDPIFVQPDAGDEGHFFY